MSSRVNELVSARRNLEGKVSIHLELNNRTIKSPYIPAIQAPRMLCRMIGTQMQRLVNQRKRQVDMGYTSENIHRLQKAFRHLEFALASKERWNCRYLKQVLNALLPHLQTIAPKRGKYAPTWLAFLAGLELIIEEEDIQAKINQIVAEHGHR